MHRLARRKVCAGTRLEGLRGNWKVCAETSLEGTNRERYSVRSGLAANARWISRHKSVMREKLAASMMLHSPQCLCYRHAVIVACCTTPAVGLRKELLLACTFHRSGPLPGTFSGRLCSSTSTALRARTHTNTRTSRSVHHFTARCPRHACACTVAMYVCVLMMMMVTMTRRHFAPVPESVFLVT